LDPRFAGSNPAEDEFLRAIKIRITTSFGGHVKPAILRHVKNPYSMKEILVGKISSTFIANFLLLCSRYVCW
jgi:hypothetical protein